MIIKFLLIYNIYVFMYKKYYCTYYTVIDKKTNFQN